MRTKYVNAAMRDGTGGEETTGVRHWIRFCVHARRLSPLRLYTGKGLLAEQLEEEALLMDFALWLVLCSPLGRVISIDTAAGYVGTVQGWHRRKFGYKIAEGLELARLKDMMKGMRREIGQQPRRPRYGVRTQQLAQAIEQHLAPSAREGKHAILDKLNWRAALSTGFCGLLRAAEFALQPGESWTAERHLSRADLSFFLNKEGIRCAALMIRPCKNGRYLHGKHFRLVLHGGGTLVDPVQHLWALVHEDPVSEKERATTPLFRTRTGAYATAMTVPEVRAMIKALMRALGEDERLFGAHSLRIGGATSALTAGVPPSVIRLAGRWNSDLWEIYARLTREAAEGVTCLIGSTPFHDLERGFHADELEMLPDELELTPEFEPAELEDEM